MRLTVLAAIAFLLAAGTARAADEITLVDNGKSDYVINVAAGASESEKFAAEELQTHIEKISGAKLPIVNGPLSTTAKAIAIGYGYTKENTEWIPGEEEFWIRVVGNIVYIHGGRVRGTLYGAHALLERMGVRWWSPDETFVPQKKTITLPRLEVHESPKLEYRDMMFGECFSTAGRLWMARNRVNGMAWDEPDGKLGGRYKFVGNLVHSYMPLLESSGHPITDDMKALVDGKRTADQPCLSSPKTVEAMIDGVLNAFQKNPGARFVVVGQMDNKNYCRCPDCAAIDEKEGSHAGQVIRFANQVAEGVEKKLPGACISTAAYEWSRKPPKDLKPRDNVFVTLCPIECDFSRPLAEAASPENKSFKEDIEGWSKIAKKLLIWHYVGNRDHYLLPNPEWFTLQPNMKFFADNKAAGVFNEGTHVGIATDMSELKMWVLAKSMWDPDQDGNKLIEEFCRGYYGPAGDDIVKYLHIMADPLKDHPFHIGRRVSMAAPCYSPDNVALAEETMRQAEKKAEGDPEFSRRVRHAHMGLWYLLAKRGPGTPTWQAVEKKLGKLDMSDVAEKLAAVARDYKITKIDDPDPVQPWLDWAKAYGELMKKGKALPPELEKAEAGGYRLIHACQLDMQPRWWKPTEGASDGWAAHVPGPGWYTKIELSPTEDFTPGKTYKLFVRAKGELAPEAAGDVWEFGVYPKGPSLKVNKDQLAGGQWHVFEIGPFKPAEGQIWWTAMMRGQGQNTAVIDCIWLVEQK